VADRDVLDLGCAAGQLSEALADRGARVVGVDISPVMVELARRRCGDRVRLHCADIGQPLPFLSDGSIDVVTASLVMHYLADWTATLSEVWRVLRPGGFLVMSVHHPDDWRVFERRNYFCTELIVDTWKLGGRLFEVRFYRRPLGATFGSLRAAGFRVDDIVEPMPLPECEEVDPGEYFELTRKPRFLYFRAVRPA
jgi:SAM-dependent methyltransferase